MNKVIRQGEVLLVPIKDKVSGDKHKTYIIGHSETGHHHVLESEKPFVISETDKQFVIELFAPAKLIHQKEVDKHNTLVVNPGKYKVVKKTEYSPWDGLIRQVHD